MRVRVRVRVGGWEAGSVRVGGWKGDSVRVRMGG